VQRVTGVLAVSNGVPLLQQITASGCSGEGQGVSGAEQRL